MTPSQWQEFCDTTWHIDREITDFLAGSTTKFSGTAWFAKCDEKQWLYSETGKLALPSGQSLHAERRFLWCPVGTADLHAVDVMFEDGRPFHQIKFARDQTSNDTHFCDPDTYEVTYAFDLGVTWSAAWRVNGPRKNYQMSSVYRPCRDAEVPLAPAEYFMHNGAK